MTAANSPNYSKPLWVRFDRTIWEEDDVPDAESIEGAWLRLFGEPFDESQAVDYVDLGDAFAWLLPNGHVYWNACDGRFIARAVITGILSGASAPDTQP
jgi:hypothetical protein